VLEDDAMVNFRMDGGTVGRLWTSSVAIGRQHGLTLQVFGETGGLRWAQEQPNQLYWMPLGAAQVIERGEAGLSPEADRTSRVTIGHAEGMPLAFANIYKDLAEAIRARKRGAARWTPPPTSTRAPRTGCGRWRRSSPWRKAARRQGAPGSTRGRRCSGGKSWQAERYAMVDDRIRTRLDQLVAAFGESEWLAGTFSAADILMVHAIRRLEGSGILEEYPLLTAYIARAADRPAYRRAFEAQHDVFRKSVSG
jgi:hypothetical protein